MDREHERARRAVGDVAAPSDGAAGKRARVEASYPTLARKLAAGGEAPTIHDAATVAVEHKDGGAPVEDAVASRVGAHLGADFSSVRVHSDPLAQEASAAMGARAFAHGSDVFLGAGESGSDLGLMAHELTHVAQQGAAGRLALQRKVEVGDADSPAEHEADAVSSAVTRGAPPSALLVDDGPVAPGQMLKSTFVAQLRAEVTAAADQELGPIYSAMGCPYIDQYFGRYHGRPAAEGEALLRRFAPGVRGVASAAAMIPIVVERVREGVRQWRDTGQAPPDLAGAEPAAAGAAAAAAGGAAALRAPDGRETLASLEADLGPGRPLDGATASRMSGALGIDVGEVRIHTGPVAAAKAASADALAFTVGPNIVMGAAAPEAGTLEGDGLLAHEIAHTAQQADAARDPVARRKPIGDEDRGAEHDADAQVAAAAATREGKGSLASRMRDVMKSGIQLQRCNTPAPTSSVLPAGSLTPGGSVAHKTGSELDTYVSASAAISAYVGPAIRAGRLANGHVHFLNDAEFQTRALAYLAGKNNPNTGAVFTDAEAAAFARTMNAYRDGADVYVHQDRGSPSTVIHEGMHLYSSDAYRNDLGFNVNEGTTEWLTRLVIAEQSLGFVRNNYPQQHTSVNKLVAKAGQAAVMDAYFNGNIAGLRTAIDGATSAGTFDNWVTFMKASNYASADALL